MSTPRIERLGYFFHPSSYPHPLGHAAAEVFLSCNEADWFFPTRAVTFRQVDETGVVTLHITCPWSSAIREYRLAPGRFFIVAQDGDLVEGFSFGGELYIDQEGDVLNCQLTSSAPLFHLTDESSLAGIVAPEFEAALARLRAEWSGRDEEFDRRVSMADPLDLFIASLQLSDSYAHRLPALDPDDAVMDERYLVGQAVRILRNAGQWPDKPPTLQQLVLEH